jgi:RHH-type proline utilization regulon transcriptional repressor/proline dehydrogenase/delta 1-pyrroline-5-carboxylate dehydrogenase
MIDLNFAGELLQRMRAESDELFSSDRAGSRVLRRAAENRKFMNGLLQFIDVYPVLSDDASLVDHARQYFGDSDPSAGLDPSDPVALRRVMEDLVSRFVVGRNLDELISAIGGMADSGFSYTLDLLGEACLSETEAEEYLEGQLRAISRIHASGHPVHITLKPTSIYSQTSPLNYSRSVEILSERMARVVDAAKALGGFVHIDMEQRQFKNITIEAFKALVKRFPGHSDLGIAIQSYLRDSEADVLSLIDFARRNDSRFTVRLVKGAYYEWERLFAEQNGWPSPVWGTKAETDIAYETNLRHLLSNAEHIFTAAATHNVRSAAMVKGLAKHFGLEPGQYEFQMLSGMAGTQARALLQMGETVRLYAPFGPLVPGMAYLVRRLVENTAAEGAIRTQYLEEGALDRILADPRTLIPAEYSGDDALDKKTTGKPQYFGNHPPADFSIAEVRAAFAAALETTADLFDAQGSPLPSARPDRANPRELDTLVSACSDAAGKWRESGIENRARVLERAADNMASRIYELAAVQVREVGKQWDQAYNDVCEAIDFLRYYAREGRKLFAPVRLSPIRAERNEQRIRPRGIYAVIGPWNFPLAISCGMTSAALVCGNGVLYKPAEESEITGRLMWEILIEAGVPRNLLALVPGPGEEIGAALVAHPDIRGIAFTGSREVGMGIIASAASPSPGSRHIKAVIAEMGGKNAIIVDEDADLDVAVEAAIYSAFGFQGQKCSAASRIIVMKEVFQEFRTRLVEAARSLIIGDPLDPGTRLGPLVSGEAEEKLTRYLAIAREEGEELLYRHPMAIFQVEGMERRICREEVFAPLLVIMPADNFKRALEMANDVDYGLTAGLISRNPAHIARAAEELDAGNIYINRSITGALVGRQPFGGHKLSGIGAKAGGADYLSQFIVPVSISQNLVRRGFSPEFSG